MAQLAKTQDRPLPPALLRSGFALLLFLCVFIPFRTPLADATVSAVKAIPDVLVLCLLVWYAVVIRFRFRFQPQDFLFLALEALAFVSTVLVNHLSVSLFIYETRSIGIYYIFYFVIRNFGYGKRELELMTGTLQLVSLPLFVLGLIEKISSKTLLFNLTFAAGLSTSNYGRLYSMFYNPNTYGLFLDFVILLSVWARVRTGRRTPVWMYATLCISLYLTISRSSMLLLAAALLVTLLYALRQKLVRWKALIVNLVVVAAAVAVVTVGVNAAANVYYDKVARYVEFPAVNTPADPNAITETVYVTPEGEERTGWVYQGHTYLDEECTLPLTRSGSIVGRPGEKRYILTKDGGMLLERFNSLSQAEQEELLSQDRYLPTRVNPADVRQVVCYSPEGEEYTGYTYQGITFLDAECTTPLTRSGTIVGKVGYQQYIVTRKGNILLERFQKLSQEEQDDLLSADRTYSVGEEHSMSGTIGDSLHFGASDRFLNMFNASHYTYDNNGRIYSLVNAVRVALDHPVCGSGFGTFGSAASLTWYPTLYMEYSIKTNFYADNQYTCIMAETGFAGLALFLAFLVVTLIRQRRDLLQFLACCIVGVFGLFYNVLEVQIASMLLWSLLAMDLKGEAPLRALARSMPPEPVSAGARPLPMVFGDLRDYFKKA